MGWESYSPHASRLMRTRAGVCKKLEQAAGYRDGGDSEVEEDVGDGHKVDV